MILGNSKTAPFCTASAPGSAPLTHLNNCPVPFCPESAPQCGAHFSGCICTILHCKRTRSRTTNSFK